MIDRVGAAAALVSIVLPELQAAAVLYRGLDARADVELSDAAVELDGARAALKATLCCLRALL